MNVENIVNGENFKRICNVVIAPDTLNKYRSYSKKNIIFCKTDFLPILFSELSHSDSENILITHQSDYEINSEIYKVKPKSIKKWFAQNVNHRDPDLIPLPIGIENHKGTDKGTLIDLDFLTTYELDFEPKNKNTDKIYCNFSLKTHPNRANVQNYLLQNGLCNLDNFGIPSREFHAKLSEHLFVASPRGNGIDCHRTWETLLMGSIPIVEKHHMYDDYELPIIQLDSWSDLITTNILEDYLKRYKSKELFTNTEQLFMDYWVKIILKEFEKI